MLEGSRGCFRGFRVYVERVIRERVIDVDSREGEECVWEGYEASVYVSGDVRVCVRWVERGH